MKQNHATHFAKYVTIIRKSFKRVEQDYNNNPLGTETAFLGALWAQCAQSAGRKAVDLGYLFADSVFCNLHLNIQQTKQEIKTNREADDIYDIRTFFGNFLGKRVTRRCRTLRDKLRVDNPTSKNKLAAYRESLYIAQSYSLSSRW